MQICEWPLDVNDWKTVDDVVMGGRSDSHLRWVDQPVDTGGADRGFLRFSGEVSLENNGGFCSTRQIRAPRGKPGLTAVSLRVRSDGQRYKLTVRTGDAPEKVSWRYPFRIDAGDWQTVTVALDEFEPWRRGTHLTGDLAFHPAAIESFGLLISDAQEGSFEIDLAEIAGLAESD